MSESIWALAGLLCLLQAKHTLADFFLQTRRMLSGRNNYVHVGRLQHVLVHGVLSAAVLGVMTTPVTLLVGLVIAELVLHYHIDYGKSLFTGKRELTPTDAGYWHMMGVDQALHQLTYVAMAWIWLLTPAAT